MFAWLERLGLKRSIYLTFSAAVAALAVATTLILNWMVRDILESSLRRRGETNVRALALQLETAIGAGDADLALEQLSRSFDPEDGAYAVALRPDGTVLAKRLAPGLATQAEASVGDQGRRGTRPLPGEGSAFAPRFAPGAGRPGEAHAPRATC
jgi:hypothetical protein